MLRSLCDSVAISKNMSSSSLSPCLVFHLFLEILGNKKNAEAFFLFVSKIYSQASERRENVCTLSSERVTGKRVGVEFRLFCFRSFGGSFFLWSLCWSCFYFWLFCLRSFSSWCFCYRSCRSRWCGSLFLLYLWSLLDRL